MAWVMWITGLPGSGKSTVADHLKKMVPDAVILRMDVLRKVVTPAPDYSDRERDLVYRAIVYTAKTLYELGHNVIIDATAHRSAWRRYARETVPDFYEIYLKCPVELCAEREMTRRDTHAAPGKIYEKGRAGAPVPGVNVPYEESEHPELIIDTAATAPDEAAERIAALVRG